MELNDLTDGMRCCFCQETFLLTQNAAFSGRLLLVICPFCLHRLGLDNEDKLLTLMFIYETEINRLRAVNRKITRLLARKALRKGSKKQLSIGEVL